MIRDTKRENKKHKRKISIAIKQLIFSFSFLKEGCLKIKEEAALLLIRKRKHKNPLQVGFLISIFEPLEIARMSKYNYST